MKYSLNRSRAEHLQDLIEDAGLSLVEAQTVQDSFDVETSFQEDLDDLYCEMNELENCLADAERISEQGFNSLDAFLDKCANGDFKISTEAEKELQEIANDLDR